MPKIMTTSMLTSSCLVALVFASGPSALAQSDDGAAAGEVIVIDSITVTARKRAESITDVPETISAFSEDALKKGSIINIDKLGLSVPNVVLSRRGDNEPNVVIRGVGSFGNVQGIGFYIDDVQNFTDQASRLVDLERIEVLKGPQGTLYGGSSVGGAVKYVTKKPSVEGFEGQATIEVGQQKIKNGNGSINIPLSDMFAARVSGYIDTNNGFLENNVTGINNDKSKEHGIRVALRFTPSDATDVNLSFRYSDLENGGNDYYTTPSPSVFRLESNLNLDVFNKRRILAGILNIEHDVTSDLSVTSLTSYTERKSEILWDLDYSPLDGVWVFQTDPVDTKVFTQEVRLQSNFDDGWNWLVGGYYARLRDRLPVNTAADVVIGTDFGGAPDFILGFHDNTSLEEILAGFATVTYSSGPFEASLGARLNHSDFFGLNRVIDESLSVKDTVVLPKLTLSYEVGPAVMVYFNLAEGYEPARFTLFNATPLLPYEPEKARNFEVGVKGQTPNALLTYEIAAFFIQSKDRQLETLVLDPSGVPNEAIGNVGDARTFGGEFALTMRPVAELSFTINGGVMDSKFTAGMFDGFEVPYAPDFSGGASVDYETEITSSLVLSLRADVSYSSAFFWDTINTLEQDSYAVFGARIAISPPDGRWEVAVRGENLTDEAYHSELQPFDGDVLARRGQPRLVVGSVSARF